MEIGTIYRCHGCKQLKLGSMYCTNGNHCKFVGAYHDNAGNLYTVLPSIDSDLFKAHILEADTGEWTSLPSISTGFVWHQSFDEAQEELNQTAKQYGWRRIKEIQHIPFPQSARI